MDEVEEVDPHLKGRSGTLLHEKMVRLAIVLEKMVANCSKKNLWWSMSITTPIIFASKNGDQGRTEKC